MQIKMRTKVIVVLCLLGVGSYLMDYFFTGPISKNSPEDTFVMEGAFPFNSGARLELAGNYLGRNCSTMARAFGIFPMRAMMPEARATIQVQQVSDTSYTAKIYKDKFYSWGCKWELSGVSFKVIPPEKSICSGSKEKHLCDSTVKSIAIEGEAKTVRDEFVCEYFVAKIKSGSELSFGCGSKYKTAKEIAGIKNEKLKNRWKEYPYDKARQLKYREIKIDFQLNLNKIFNLTTFEYEEK